MEVFHTFVIALRRGAARCLVGFASFGAGWFRVVRRRLVSRRSAPVGFASFGAGWFRVVRRRVWNVRGPVGLCWPRYGEGRRGGSGRLHGAVLTEWGRDGEGRSFGRPGGGDTVRHGCGRDGEGRSFGRR